ncbi:phosphocarrier protein [Halolactibacillus halophilus]|uniref:Phosphocarrier protein n=1 Tax=Halolactibacillus halophilus TaxID=306540 RepID=A0A1I5PK51_9BACI|nr:HPr family phosphocarrier protein [Halolactibacillus halophilus]GEM02052.1 hypothetical protein HHA03_15840 [Halolactibacillus halophilus]SFP34425.1 phosphocarrier protein [Halolactibacillus halophilus]
MKCIVNLSSNLQIGLASTFVQLANWFSTEIHITKRERRVNAENIMGLLSLVVARGEAIDLSGTDRDSDEAIQTLGIFL